MAIVLFFVGLAALIVGAQALVRGASSLAAVFGISPLVIGLTVVAFGTSSPELAVSVGAALSGQANIALGNVIGSNIFNVLFILGVSALILPLVVSQQLIRLDVPLMILLSALVWLLAADGRLGGIDGSVLMIGLVIYTVFLVVLSRKQTSTAPAEPEHAVPHAKSGKFGWLKQVGLVVIGLALLVLGADWLVDAAVTFARYLGVSELVIALTIIAAGTSLPEVVTSIVAAWRGERDIAVGNVVGSNLFNIMGVLGLSAVLAPGGIDVASAVLRFDFAVMFVVALACLPIFFSGGRISRAEGALLLGYYVAYTLYLILAAAQHDTLPRFSAVMFYFVIPLTLFTLLVIAFRQFRRDNDAPPQ